jgi:hypothetical protein
VRTGFSGTIAMGSPYGVGPLLVKCWDCGGALLDPADRAGHEEWHARTGQAG